MFSALCREAVIDPDLRRPLFIPTSEDTKTYDVILASDDENLDCGLESIVAIPVEQWNADMLTPNQVCVAKEGVLVQFTHVFQ